MEKIINMSNYLVVLLFLFFYLHMQQLNLMLEASQCTFYFLDYRLGAIIGGIIVLLYCFSGGIRASIWTDAAQSFVMLIAMFLIVLFFGINELGGFFKLYRSII